VMRCLEGAGHSVYLVGGCVRDVLLSKEPSDYDIATSAEPDEVIGLFKHVYPTGIAYGTVTLVEEGHSFEVTTYRSDLEYIDGRRPHAVEFSKHIYEDLARRDFTINAMAMSSAGELIDPFNGLVDLKSGIIKAVGEPSERFKEDALRKLRAVRFSGQLGFELDKDTLQAMINCPDLTRVSVERMAYELQRLLLSDYPHKGLQLLSQSGLLAECLPELVPMVAFNQHHPAHMYTVYEHTIEVVRLTPKNLALRWAALLHDIGKPSTFFVDKDGIGHFYGHESVSVEIATHVMNRLKFSNQLKQDVLRLIEHHMTMPVLENKALKRWMQKVGLETIERLLLLMRADAIGRGTLNDLCYYDALNDQIQRILTEKVPFGRQDLAVDGHLLMDCYPVLREDPKLLGPIFDKVLQLCMENPDLNEKDHILKLVETLLKPLVR